MTRRLKQNGFSLIETIIAMAIMSGAILVLALSWSGNVARVKTSRINNTMAFLLERKMTEVEIAYQGKPVNQIADEDAGDFGEKYPGYRWELKTKAFEMPSLSSLLISKEGGADENLLSVVNSLSEYSKDAIKEVSVSVIYTSKLGKEIKNSVATFFVDYKKPLPIPGLPSADSSSASDDTGDSGSSSGDSPNDQTSSSDPGGSR